MEGPEKRHERPTAKIKFPINKNPMSERRFGPPQFTATGECWTDDYRLVPMGLLKRPVLIGRTRRTRPGWA